MTKIYLENLSDLAESQRLSYFNFLYKGISAELRLLNNPFKSRKRKKIEMEEISRNLNEKKVLELIKDEGDIYISPNRIKIRGPHLDFQSALFSRLTYSVQVFVKLYYSPTLEKLNEIKHQRKKQKALKKYLLNRKFKIEQDILLAEVPLITDEGSFLITGVERIVVNQIIRSPGVYFRKEYGTSVVKPKVIYTATIISDRGIWLKMILHERPNILPYLKEGKRQYGSKLFDHVYFLLNDLRGKSALSTASSILNKEFTEVDEEEEKNKFSIFRFFEYFYISYDEIFDTLNYPETFKEKEEFILNELRDELHPETRSLISKTFYDKKVGYFSLGEIGRFKMNKRLGLNLTKEITYVTGLDFLLILDKLFELKYRNIPMDEIDHIKNKQIRSAGEFLRMQLRIGINKSFEPITDMPLWSSAPDVRYEPESISDEDKEAVVNRRFFEPYIISSCMKEFFKTSQLSQFMDQINPLSEITQKRKVSVFGPNGLKRDSISIQVRDIHPSQYGRLCPVETPEGENAGLITSIAMHSRMSYLGWLEAPYYFIENEKVNRKGSFVYLNPEQESKAKVAFCDTALLSNQIVQKELLSMKEDSSFTVRKRKDLSFLTTSPLQLLSIATSLIPFIEHDDANRALMGSNMQRQAVPLLCPQKAIVGTGFESAALLDSDMVIKTYAEGYVKEANAFFIDIFDKENQCVRYFLQKYSRSNQETSLNQKPCVWQGEKIFSGQIIADAASSIDGELALGRNLTIAYMPWEGYNYEDAIVLNERLVTDDCLSSIHIEEFETVVPEFFERDYQRFEYITKLSQKDQQSLDKNGIVQIGTYVSDNDILFANLVDNTNDLTPERKLELAIKNQKQSLKDISFRVPAGSEGRVVEIRIFPSSYAIFSRKPMHYKNLLMQNKNRFESFLKEKIAFKQSIAHINDKKAICHFASKKVKLLRKRKEILDKKRAEEHKKRQADEEVQERENELFYSFYKCFEKDILHILLRHLLKSRRKRMRIESNMIVAQKDAREKQESIKANSYKVNSLQKEDYSLYLGDVFSVSDKKQTKKLRLKEKKKFQSIDEFSAPLDLDNDFFSSQLEEYFDASTKIRFYIAQTRKIEIGDKLAGRHGNKGIISRILPRQDMPFLPNGKSIDIIFNPLGVPSRMNVGQLFEALLGLAGENLGKRFKVQAFDEIYGEEASRILITQKLKEAAVKTNIDWLFSNVSPGKILLRDGRTGHYFDNAIAVGKTYILKLIHLVEDKIHARDTGPYSMITEQPLGGKALQGGQRLGEMEVWALEAYGASYNLQELLTLKSDDIEGRNDMYEAILTGDPKPRPSIPETFLVLIRELNALGLDFSLKKLNMGENVPELADEISDDIHDIFQTIEKRLKLNALYGRKKYAILPLPKKNLEKEKKEKFLKYEEEELMQELIESEDFSFDFKLELWKERDRKREEILKKEESTISSKKEKEIDYCDLFEIEKNKEEDKEGNKEDEQNAKKTESKSNGEGERKTTSKKERAKKEADGSNGSDDAGRISRIGRGGEKTEGERTERKTRKTKEKL